MKILLCLLFLVSCGGDDFKKYHKLGEFRILGIAADTPEINTAATVNLTPLMSFPDGGNTIIDIDWEACPDPGIDYGADISCASSVASLKLSGSTTFNTSGLSGTYYTGNITSIGIAVPAGAIALLSSLSTIQNYNGVDYIVIFNFQDQTSGAKITSLKRIHLSTKAGGDLNTNPTIGGTIQNNGINLAAFPTAKGNFLLDGASAPQTYTMLSYTGLETLTEDMTVSWFTSSGNFIFNRTDIDENNEYDPAGKTTGVFVAVYRDNRGGFTYELVSY